MGRLDADLGHIVDLQAAALVRGRLDAGCGIGQDVVEHAGGDAHGGLLVGHALISSNSRSTRWPVRAEIKTMGA